jgi:hypothetical protein
LEYYDVPGEIDRSGLFHRSQSNWHVFGKVTINLN